MVETQATKARRCRGFLQEKWTGDSYTRRREPYYECNVCGCKYGSFEGCNYGYPFFRPGQCACTQEKEIFGDWKCKQTKKDPYQPPSDFDPSTPLGHRGQIAEQVDDLVQQATQLFKEGRYDEALVPATHARDLARTHLGENHRSYALALSLLAALNRARGVYDAAELLYREALDVLGRTVGEQHPDHATLRNNLGLMYWTTGDYASAGPLLRAALAVRGRALGKQHQSYATTLNNLGLLHKAEGYRLVWEQV